MSYWKKCLSTGDYQYITTGEPAPGDIVVPWWEVELVRKEQRIAELEQRIAELEQRIAELEAQLPKVVRPEKETDYPLSYWCDCDGEVFSGDVACRQCGAKLDWSEA